jgi:membrane protein
VGGFETGHSAYDRFQQQHRSTGFPLPVPQKHTDDHDHYLAATITYYGFFAIFPLLLVLVLTTVLGFLLEGHPQLERRIVNSALGQLHRHRTAAQPRLAARQRTRTRPRRRPMGRNGRLPRRPENAMNHLWGVPSNAGPTP